MAEYPYQSDYPLYFGLATDARFIALGKYTVKTVTCMPCPEGVLFFMIKQKNIRDKMRYSNLSNNMIISEL
jgi:hypothetical protein